jgi:hypothetical protein
MLAGALGTTPLPALSVPNLSIGEGAAPVGGPLAQSARYAHPDVPRSHLRPLRFRIGRLPTHTRHP